MENKILQNILSSTIISNSAIAAKLYSNLALKGARDKMDAKIKRTQGRKLSNQEEEKIIEIVKKEIKDLGL